MKVTAIACVASFGLFWAGLVWLRKRQLDMAARVRTLLLARREDDLS